MNFAVALFLLAAAVQVYARPEGAPPAACAMIFPVGHTNPANQVSDVSTNPYQLSLQGFQFDTDPMYRYQPGAQYTLTISAPEGIAPFRGLLVQARLAADGTTPVGTFSSFTANTQQSGCSPGTSAVTHSNPSDKRCEVLTWTAPPSGTGTIRFHYAVVRQYTPGSVNMFYAPLTSTTIEESTEPPSGDNPNCDMPQPSPETPDLGLGGDPHYSVLLPNGQLLCFSVHGNRDFSFNLISNKLMHMNALFVSDPVRDEITWIGSLGIVVRNTPYKKSNVTKLRFEAKEKKVYVGHEVSLDVKNVEKLTFLNGKLIISEAPKSGRIAQHPEVHVDLQDIGIGFKVRFMKHSLDMTWEKVNKQPHDSHGLIGQFFREGIEIDETRKLLLLPTMDPVPVMRRPVWSFMEREVPEEQLCWEAMNWGYQGEGLIEGHYLDYLVDSVLSGDFKFKARHQQQ